MLEEKGTPDPIYEQRKHLLEFAGKMEDSWWRLKDDHNAFDRAWEKFPKAKLEKIHEQISGLIEECQKELKERPSPKNTVVDWFNSLDRERREIAELIEKKS